MPWRTRRASTLPRMRAFECIQTKFNVVLARLKIDDQVMASVKRYPLLGGSLGSEYPFMRRYPGYTVVVFQPRL